VGVPAAAIIAPSALSALSAAQPLRALGLADIERSFDADDEREIGV